MPYLEDIGVSAKQIPWQKCNAPLSQSYILNLGDILCLTRERWIQGRYQIIPKLSGYVGLGPSDSSEHAKWAPQSIKT